MTFVLILRRLIALALFVYVVVAYRRAAESAGGTPWKWSSLGVLAFYGTFLLAAAAIAVGYVALSAMTGGGFDSAERLRMPLVTKVSVGVGLAAAFATIAPLIRYLRRRQATNASDRARAEQPIVDSK